MLTGALPSDRILNANWGTTIGNAILDKDNSGTSTPVAVAASAAIAFPGDYDSDATSGSCIQFIAIDTGAGEGDVYKISGAEAPSNSAATDLNVGSAYGLSNIDVTGLAAYGDSPKSRKEPTGGSMTYVLMSPDFSSTGKVYSATSGDESAFSISQDNGNAWNQVSLIDTDISTIVDLAPSPSYSRDNTLFLLTYGSKHSLWRSLNGGNTWETTRITSQYLLPGKAITSRPSGSQPTTARASGADSPTTPTQLPQYPLTPGQ